MLNASSIAFALLETQAEDVGSYIWFDFLISAFLTPGKVALENMVTPDQSITPSSDILLPFLMPIESTSQFQSLSVKPKRNQLEEPIYTSLVKPS